MLEVGPRASPQPGVGVSSATILHKPISRLLASLPRPVHLPLWATLSISFRSLLQCLNTERIPPFLTATIRASQLPFQATLIRATLSDSKVQTTLLGPAESSFLFHRCFLSNPHRSCASLHSSRHRYCTLWHRAPSEIISAMPTNTCSVTRPTFGSRLGRT